MFSKTISLIAAIAVSATVMGCVEIVKSAMGDVDFVEMTNIEVSCDELGASSSVNAVLVGDVDPIGWTAIYGSDGQWIPNEDVLVIDGDLALYGPCLSGQSIRVTYW